MIVKQFYLGCLAHASYMVVDEETKVAAVVDPQRDVQIYLDEAEEHGWSIRYVFLTHFHADFLAGHIELRDRCGAKIYLGAKAEAEYEFTPVKQGDVVEYGRVRLQILETPGHTPEGISILVFDLNKSETDPHAVLTGDTLFIGDVGRPDLLASVGVTAEELAGMLLRLGSPQVVHLPNETLVYPAHGAGSLCGRNLSDETVSTIGEQKKFNYALQPMSRDEFMQLVQVEQPQAPEYFVYDAIKNRQERESLESTMKKSLRSLSLEEVLELQAAGAQVVDVRDGVDFDGGHLKGALNIGLAGKYATWAGSLLSHDRPIVVIAESEHEEEAVMRLGRIGFDNVAGYLAQGMAALDGRPELVQMVERITAAALHDRQQAGEVGIVLDVRSESERQVNGAVAGSLNVPLMELEDRLNEVPDDVPVTVHCAGGYRSASLAACCKREGRDNLFDLVGGFQAWKTSGLPVEDVAATAEA